MPLPSCAVSIKCQCHFEALPERRTSERRRGRERRELLRFDTVKRDRRSGGDQRGKTGYQWESSI
jgi:hypothetical protein